VDSLAISSKMTGLGDCSSVRLEHLVVVQDVASSNLVSHPIYIPANWPWLRCGQTSLR
jgi:hypothetical protein